MVQRLCSPHLHYMALQAVAAGFVSELGSRRGSPLCTVAILPCNVANALMHWNAATRMCFVGATTSFTNNMWCCHERITHTTKQRIVDGAVLSMGAVHADSSAVCPFSASRQTDVLA